MSAYNIELPDVVLAGLYKKLIVQGEGKAVEGGWVAPAAGSGSAASGAMQQTASGTGLTAPDLAQQPAAKPGTTDAIASPGSTTAAETRTAASGGNGSPAIAIPQTEPVSPVLSVLPDLPAATAADIPKQGLPTDPGFSGYKLLGNNRQQVTVVVRFPGEAFLPESHLQFLSKMIGACKLNLGDVAIVNDASVRVDMNVLKAQLQPKTVLLFGVAPEETALPLSFPTFKAQEYAGTTYLYTPPLEELNTETDDGKLLKRRLWDSLRKIFGV